MVGELVGWRVLVVNQVGRVWGEVVVAGSWNSLGVGALVNQEGSAPGDSPVSVPRGVVADAVTAGSGARPAATRLMSMAITVVNARLLCFIPALLFSH